ncbi:MAG: SelB domain-containing protein, partial [Aggregatilineales bacterium]
DLAPSSISQLAGSLHLSVSDVTKILALMPDAVILPDGFYLSATGWERLTQAVQRTMDGFHRAEPLRRGMAAETLRNRLTIELPAFRALTAYMAAKAVIRIESTGEIALPDHRIRLNPVQQAAFDRLMAQFTQTPFRPPSYTDAKSIVGSEVLRGVFERGDLLQIAPDVLFTPNAFRDIATYARDELRRAGKIDAKTLRDHFSASRKYALAVLEYLDALDLTRRAGDDHIPGAADWTLLLGLVNNKAH